MYREMVTVSRARSADSSMAGGRALVGAGLLAIVIWRSDWVRVVGSWYFAQVQAFCAYLASSQVLKAAFVWYLSECQALGTLIVKSMIHR